MGLRLILKPSEASSDGSRRLRELLQRRTQRAVAEIVGCSVGAVGQYARDERRPEPDQRRRFEQTLGIPAPSWDEENPRRSVPVTLPAPSTIAREVPTEREDRTQAQRRARVETTEAHRDLAVSVLCALVLPLKTELELERVPTAGRLAVMLCDELLDPFAELLARHDVIAEDRDAMSQRPKNAAKRMEDRTR